jgi:hypothetical protein
MKARVDAILHRLHEQRSDQTGRAQQPFALDPRRRSRLHLKSLRENMVAAIPNKIVQ